MSGFMARHRSKSKKFPLLEVKRPELFRDIFPYKSVPRIKFDGVLVPINLPEKIWITDTTFRDGQQARPPYTVKQIVDLFDLMHKLDGNTGLIRASEFFLYSSKDKEAVTQCLERGYRYPEVTGWIRAVKSDFLMVKQMGLKETGILTSASDYHIFLKLKKDRKKAMDGYLGVVKDALNSGVRVRCHFEDITRADIYGFCVPFAQKLMRLGDEAKLPVKLRLCDTLGFGISHPEAALPRSIPKLIHAMVYDAGVPSEQLEWHGHNDFHRVHTNSVTAWLYGCCGINSALLGYGERTGNSPLEALVMEYLALKGPKKRIKTTAITEIAEYFSKHMDADIPSNYPFVGKSFNTTRAGIHVDGVIKNEEIYNIFDTTTLLNRPLEIQITDKSGVAGVAMWINRHRDVTDIPAVSKRHAGVEPLYQDIMKMYEKGRTTSITDAEMRVLAERHMPKYFVSDLDRIKERAANMACGLIKKLMANADIRSMNAKRITKVLQAELKAEPFTQLISVVNPEGKTVAMVTHSRDKKKFDEALGTDFSDRNWFIEPMQKGQSSVSGLYTSRITGELCITVSGPIHNRKNKIVGVVELDIKFEDLAKIERAAAISPA